MNAIVYSVTTLHAAAEPFEAELPFQIAIVEIEGKGRRTVRIEGPAVAIGDKVVEVTPRRFRAAPPM
ncbi:MAG: OB-fold domain-containing protein [Bryobacterales bacterium]